MGEVRVTPYRAALLRRLPAAKRLFNSNDRHQINALCLGGFAEEANGIYLITRKGEAALTTPATDAHPFEQAARMAEARASEIRGNREDVPVSAAVELDALAAKLRALIDAEAAAGPETRS